MINNYNIPFQITENIGNNVFCFDKLKKTKIYVPSLITVNISDFKSDIEKYLKIWANPVFREKQESSKSFSSQKEIIEYKWLENFIQIEWTHQTIYIVDNHNHALYFRYKEYFAWNIQKWSELIHIDQHTDMNENKYNISTSLDKVNFEERECALGYKGRCPEDGGVCKQEIENIFNFTNNNCNVWNFIKPAVEEWLVWKITQINTEYSLLTAAVPLFDGKRGGGDFIHTEILDIDLDFRAPEMSIEKYQETINITKKLIQNSRVITIATSPYFLDQNLAIRIIQDLFKKKA